MAGGAYGSTSHDEKEGRISRALITAGLAGLTLTVLALLAAGSSAAGRRDATKRPSALLGVKQLRLPMLEQTEAQKEEVRKLLESGSYNFAFGDSVVPAAGTGGHEAMVSKAPTAQSLHLEPKTKAGVVARIAAKHAAAAAAAGAAVRPRHLQGGATIHLGLRDHEVTVDTLPRREEAVAQKKVRADPLTDDIVQGHYQIQ
jgi:hypothetical protein